MRAESGLVISLAKASPVSALVNMSVTTLVLEKNDAFASIPDGDVFFMDLWVEDSLGRRHRVKEAKHNLELLWKS